LVAGLASAVFHPTVTIDDRWSPVILPAEFAMPWNRISAMPLLVGLIVLGVGRPASCAPPVSGKFHPDLAIGLKLTAELELTARARSEPAQLELAATFYHILKDRSRCEAILTELEARVELESDDAKRLDREEGLAYAWATVDPSRARKHVANADRLMQATSNKIPDVALSAALWEIGEYRRSLESLKRYFDHNALEAMYFYGDLAAKLLDRDQPEMLEEVRKTIREAKMRPADVQPGFLDDRTVDYGRIFALADAGLPEEAEACYWRQSAAPTDDPSDSPEPGPVIVGYMRAGKTEAARTFLHKVRANVDRAKRYELAPLAAIVGEFESADEWLSDVSSDDGFWVLDGCILIAHQSGAIKWRDKWLTRFEAYLRKSWKDDGEPHREPTYAMASVEAAIGRYDSALKLLPTLDQERAFYLRYRALHAIFREHDQYLFGRRIFGDESIFLSNWKGR
jgi:hypothetical protein